MISLVKPTPPKKIKAEIKFGTIYVNESNSRENDLCDCFVIRRITNAEKFAKNNIY